MKEPVRSILIYADGRVYETPFRLEGLYYIQTDYHEGGRTVQRVFRGNIARDMRDGDAGHGLFTMVYAECPDAHAADLDMKNAIEVNGTPVHVDTPLYPRNRDARFAHKECRANGGHKTGTMDHCSICGLSGHVIHTMRYVDECEEREAKESGALRDTLVKVSDECVHLKAENSDLRREVERLTRRVGT